MDQKPQTNPPIPTKWPGAFEAYKYSKKAVLRNLETLIVIALIVFALNAIFNLPSLRNSAANLIFFGIFIIIVGAQVSTYLAGVNNKALSIGEALSKGLSLWPKLLLLEIAVGLISIVSLLLFIIPFFFIMPRLVLSFYFLVDKDMGVVDAIKSSWESTRGNVGSVWGIIGVMILMVLPVITIVGVLITIYFLFMYSAVFAVLYNQLLPIHVFSAPNTNPISRNTSFNLELKKKYVSGIKARSFKTRSSIYFCLW